ncbi:MAG: glycosyltransferase [Flavobacteriales bacterium]|nr:glycosyltransferase [Flavobacteriales bacterium]
MKLFVLLSRVPYPLEKGDKLRAYHLIARLSKDHRVYLCCLSDQPSDPEHLEHLRTICDELSVIRLRRWRIVLKLVLAIFSRLPFQVAYFHHRAAQRRIDRAIERFAPDHIFCQLVRTSEYIRDHYSISKTLDYMDTLSKGMERRTENASVIFRPLLAAETRRLIAYENLMFDLFDNRIIISEQDRAFLYHPMRNEVAVIPNGVDTVHFQPRDQEKHYDLVFTGNMNYPPNIDSVMFLVDRVLPLVRRERPGTSLLISGVDPSPRIRELQERDPLIRVTGWVKDIRDSYASARCFVAPMQIGTGLQNKILEAMAMRLPCITSELANNAVGAESGSEILIGHVPEDYAGHILHLLSDEQERERIASNGYSFVQARFDWQRSAAAIDRLIRQNERVTLTRSPLSMG